MPDAVLALNAGSSSIKFGLFEIGGRDDPVLVSKGVLDDAGFEPRFTAKDPSGAALTDRRWPAGASHADLLGALLDWVDAHLGTENLVAVGHRVVHGGRDFARPVRLTDEAIAAIERLTPLAPLHQPRSLEPIRAMAALRPGLPQVGCFDTAFHHALAPPVSRFAIPRRYEQEGIRRYGFHGLSYEFIAGRLRAISPGLAGKRTVVAHLGSGASLCAMRDGKSVDTTMGFSALDGLVMGTRCGSLDPGIVLHLQQAHGLSPTEVEDLLYRSSGLLGVSGLSSDMRLLLASADPHAAEAVDLFAFSIARHTAVMANSLGGLECLVFTGGIGEHAPDIRALACERLLWLGAELDPLANRDNAGQIGAPASRVDIRVIPTDEEMVIARHTLALIGA